MTEQNIQWKLTSRPAGPARRENFEVVSSPVPAPASGEVVVRNIYLMVPASMRLWMNEKDSYFPAQPLGEVMRGITLGVVEQSAAEALPVGTYVNGMGGWQHYHVAAADELMPVSPDPGIPLGAYRTVLDVQGITAYCGLAEVGAPAEGETLVVTAAAGSIGSLVCQIGKKLGLRVVGIAGGPRKCSWLVDELGIDGAIDYKSSDVDSELARLCPDGVDVVFENVGGSIMASVIEHLNLHARIALCGLVSGYDGGGQDTPAATMMELVNRRVRMEGFIVMDFLPRYAEVVGILEPWVRDGSLRYELDIVEGGLDMATEAMGRLFRGENKGMQLVQLSPES
jgi:hypothetical protein